MTTTNRSGASTGGHAGVLGFDDAGEGEAPLDMAALVELGRATMAKSFRQAPIVFTRGEGCYLWDAEGRRYLDFVGGLAVNGLGHSHPRIVEAVSDQIRTLVHVSNLYFNEPAIRLSKRLSDDFQRATGGPARVFLCNSGTEATEAAMKLARRYAYAVKKEPQRNVIVSFEHSFHGRTYGAMTFTGQPKYQEGFGPIVPGVRYASFNDLASVEAVMGPDVCAVFVEPIQAEGGLFPAAPGFLRGLRELCDRHGALLCLDEVQVGCGRTGRFFAFETHDVRPDVVWLAKALGAGIPIGAMLCSEATSDGFAPGSHGTTFGGNAFAAQVALTVLEVFEEDGILDNVRETGATLNHELTRLSERFDVLTGPRGVGLIQGLGFREEWAFATADACMKRGLLVNKLNTKTLRFLPPLIAQKAHVRAAVELLSDALGEVKRNPPTQEGKPS